MGKTADELIAFAQEREYEITRSQLERWHRQGLLPRPRRVHVTGRRGSASYYPEGIEGQVVTLCQMHAQHRKLADIRVGLWWHGHAVDLVHVRQDLIAALMPLARAVKQGSSQGRDALDVVEDALPQAVRRGRHPIVRAVKRHLSGSEDDTYNVLMTLIGLHLSPAVTAEWFESEDQWTNQEGKPLEAIFRRGLGIDGIAGPLTLDDAQRITQVTQYLLSPEQAITQASDDALSQARDDARLTTEGFSTLGAILHAIGADRKLGLEALRWLRADTTRAKAVWIVGMLGIANNVPRATIESILTPLAEHLSSFRTVKRILSEQPALAPQIRRTTVQAIRAVQVRGQLEC